MSPLDPHHQFDQPSRPDEVEQTEEYPAPIPTSPLPAPGHLYYRTDDDTPLPLPYDDRDPTEQVAPAYRPPALLPPSPDHAANGQLYPPPQPPPPQLPQRYPPYQAPAPPPQIVYIRQRRPSLCSISCSILSILLLMTCGLVGLGIFHGVTSALDTAGKTIPARFAVLVFCSDETAQNYSGAYQEFSSQLEDQISLQTFTQKSLQLDQQYGQISTCTRSNSSPDTTTANTVTIQVDVIRGGSGSVAAGKTSQGNILLVLQGSDWRIDQIDASLKLG
ncbi:MAG: hypothetical protein ACLQUY_07895 [Ktedonobacterales bacterium]